MLSFGRRSQDAASSLVVKRAESQMAVVPLLLFLLEPDDSRLARRSSRPSYYKDLRGYNKPRCSAAAFEQTRAFYVFFLKFDGNKRQESASKAAPHTAPASHMQHADAQSNYKQINALRCVICRKIRDIKDVTRLAVHLSKHALD